MTISDEILNRYMDGQLDSVETDEVFSAITSDSKLAIRLAQLREVRDLLKLAYQVVPDQK